MGYTLTGQPISFDPNVYRRIELYDVAVDQGLPAALGYQTVMTLKSSWVGIETVYNLNAMVRMEGNKPVCLYYVAYNVRLERPEFCIGPLQLNDFCENITLYTLAATNFFGVMGHKSKRDVKRMRMAQAAVRGDVVEMVKLYGQYWVAALQDPEWWISSTITAATIVPAKNYATRVAEREMAYQRALRTRHAEQYQVTRSIRVLSRPEKFFHIIRNWPAFSIYAEIRRTGGLRLSTNPKTGAQYGVGAYAYGAQRPRPVDYDYFEFTAPPGTAVELIEAPGESFYRLLPPEGDVLKVKFDGHSFSPEEMRIGEAMVGD
ncbi:MAG: hypothetical protein FD175_1621 [Beijerinckiaceae bacterium]|nr:MAG: hypothetical protein FD175_1621 [Beijerinckiaceae bacterium]